MKDRILITSPGHGVMVGGRFDGWMMRQHPDGQWVSVEKLPSADPYQFTPECLKPAPTPVDDLRYALNAASFDASEKVMNLQRSILATRPAPKLPQRLPEYSHAESRTYWCSACAGRTAIGPAVCVSCDGKGWVEDEE